MSLSTTFLIYFFDFVFYSMSNGEGGIWTLAPLLTTCTLSRGVPSATWVLLHKIHKSWYINLFNYDTSSQRCGFLKHRLTERMGFEPMRPFGQTVFKTASLWPLRYLSMWVSLFAFLYFPNARLILAKILLSVNNFFHFF